MRKNIFYHISIYVISIVIFLIVRWILKNWQTENVITYVEQSGIFIDKYKIYIETALIIMLITFAEILARFYTHYKKGSIAIASGMFLFKPNSTERQIKRSEDFLRKVSLGCGLLCIRGATGWETFGSSGSPLYEAAKSCREARIILIYPLSDTVLERARHLHVSVYDYRKQIYDSINYLRSLRRNSARPEYLTLKMYQGYPFWKYIILEDYAWVQQYPREGHVKNSPCYAFQRLPISDMKGIYDHLLNQFLIYWDSPNLGIYNFQTEQLEFFNNRGQMTESRPIR
jgi:hypothetical protein